MSNTSIQLNSVLICEDIRREISGKAIFIGVFPGDITVHESPANLMFSFWFDCFTKEHVNRFEVKIVLRNNSDNSSEELYKNVLTNTIDNKIPIDEGKHINVALVGLPIRVEQDSTLIVSARQLKGKWKVLSRKGITFAAIPT